MTGLLDYAPITATCFAVPQFLPPDPQARHHRRQVTPSIWTACHTARPSGVSTGTWLLILGELSCWLAFGLHKSDPRLIILGTTGVTASALIRLLGCEGFEVHP